MVLNISYDDKRQEDEINNFVGSSYTFWQSLKMRGSGSQKLIIKQSHDVFKPYLTQRNSTKYCNIELRPRGIGLRFRFKLEAIGWFIPYEHLEIIFSDNHIHLNDTTTQYFMQLEPSHRSKIDQQFMDKLLTLKQ
ncbi:MAG: hypothetical protein HQ474_09840 [Flammeovirgaceae bacterium]|jgi:hypothetical protein|nr:hypothetical protein [Flammeovirgaceae bacterium]|tara:strand:- start:16303 stop:16707 length:405 start_codon:yes stop_codon:yes gene_type:complete